jgi:hypothetical protein
VATLVVAKVDNELDMERLRLPAGFNETWGKKPREPEQILDRPSTYVGFTLRSKRQSLLCSGSAGTAKAVSSSSLEPFVKQHWGG